MGFLAKIRSVQTIENEAAIVLWAPTWIELLAARNGSEDTEMGKIWNDPRWFVD